MRSGAYRWRPCPNRSAISADTRIFPALLVPFFKTRELQGYETTIFSAILCDKRDAMRALPGTSPRNVQ
ncbi:hypothetical protein RV134_250115 [Roseovarius sp. EC-HK134]|nr:hypothetical protein RV420_280095 [Roseovarius sp. EC-SD190]VVT05733.1 hypothetical protein RV134_250115 [Roseovarius sp. EC-HK134]